MAMTLIAVNAHRIAAWMGGGGGGSRGGGGGGRRSVLPRLHDRCTDVNVTQSNLGAPKQGVSGAACAALALALLLSCRLRVPNVAVTGFVDLRGVVGPVGGLKEKIAACRKKGVPLLLMPLRNVGSLRAEEAGGWESEQDVAYFRERVKGVHTLVDLLAHRVEGT